MMRAFVIALGVAVMTFWAPAVAAAKPRVAIVAFDGDSQGALQDVVIELLEGEVSLVGPRQVTRAMDKLSLDSDMSSKQLKKLAKELEADSIIRGEVSEKGAHSVLHLRLFVNGKRVKGFKVEYGSAKSQKFKDALRDKLLEKLAIGSSSDGSEATAGDETSEPPKKKKKKKGGDDEATSGDDSASADEASESGDEKPKKKKKKKKGGDDESESTGDDGGGDDEDPVGGKGKRTGSRGDGEEGDGEEIDASTVPTDRPAHPANRAGVRVDFGPSFSARTLAFTSRNFEEAPKTYANNPVPGARIEGELYPLAISKPHSFIGGLGIGGEFDQTLKLYVQSTVQLGTKFPVTQKHFSIGPRLRLVFGHKVTSPSVTLAAGYMSRTFKVDTTALMEGNIIDLPDVGYKGYNAGVSVRFPVIPKVAVFAGGRGVFVTTTGAIQTAAQYGQAKVTGFDGMLGVDVIVAKRIAVKAVGELTQMGFAFTGTGQMSNNRDGDPTTKDVGGAADRYLGAALLLGVMY